MNELKLGIYRHFKGNYYDVLCIAKDATDGTSNHGEVVVYRSLSDGQVYVRELSEFCSTVDKAKYPDVRQRMRFEAVEP